MGKGGERMGRIQLLAAAESFFLRALATECKSNEGGNLKSARSC